MKKSDFIHILYTPFTGLGLHSGYRGDDWFRYRIKIFKQYTLKSLLNQTNKDFIHWISFRPEEAHNQITKDLYLYLHQIAKDFDYRFIMTFGGLAFWDDKFENDNLLERLEQNLPQLQSLSECSDRQFVLKTIVPSDDMYRQDAIEQIQREVCKIRGGIVGSEVKTVRPLQEQAITIRSGYLHNAETQKLAEWNPQTNPPFYTIVYPTKDFFDPKRHFKYVEGYKSHEDIVKIFNTRELSDRLYCVLVHKQNISTGWFHPYRGKIFNPVVAKELILWFGVTLDSISIAKGWIRSALLFTKHQILRVLSRLGIAEVLKRIKRKFT